MEPHVNVGDDDLMKHVTLYDVVERKYAGFSQIINDCFYGWDCNHPYWDRMESGKAHPFRNQVAKTWTGKHSHFQLPEWLYIFILHRVTGSAINYAKQPSGYHNTILFELYKAQSIEDMTWLIKNYRPSFYTSVGYQFPQFPKPKSGEYKRGGDYFLCEYAPRLARDLAEFLYKSNAKKDIREIGEFMFNWNTKNGLKRYKFQYSATIADICDWFPVYVNRETHFYYGSNAVECIKYLAKPASKMQEETFLDEVMTKIYEDTGSVPYNAEDVCCDFIRWVENYIKPGGAYDHLDRDRVWGSCRIKDHPFGRQKPMLDLGLLTSFNNINAHPADDMILRHANLSVADYKRKVAELHGA